jgi:hypothetical protein
MEGTRVWRGRVRDGSREEHDRFVEWLNTDEARLQFGKFLLTGYTLAEDGDALTITLAAEEPPPIIRFLRNPRMWPEFWEFESAGAGGASAAGTERVRWRRGNPGA